MGKKRKKGDRKKNRWNNSVGEKFSKIIQNNSNNFGFGQKNWKFP